LKPAGRLEERRIHAGQCRAARAACAAVRREDRRARREREPHHQPATIGEQAVEPWRRNADDAHGDTVDHHRLIAHILPAERVLPHRIGDDGRQA